MSTATRGRHVPIREIKGISFTHGVRRLGASGRDDPTAIHVPMVAMLSVVVVTSHGCDHAEAVLAAVRSQMAAKDELIVLEPDSCDASSWPPRERHVAAGTPDEFSMRVRGLGESKGSCVLFLEDHGIPGPRFLSSLSDLMDGHPGLQGLSFFLSNGTPENDSSRALFLYVCGLADPGIGRVLPELVGSTFALAGRALETSRGQARRGQLRPGDLEYQLCPTIANQGLEALPLSLTVAHCQRNSLSEAVSATFWNARFAGSAERSSVPLRSALLLAPRRYLGRVAHLASEHPESRSVIPQLMLLGAVSLSGWWGGRLLGPGRSHEKLRRAHPQPASSRAA